MKLLIIRHAESIRNVTMQGKVFFSHESEKTKTPTRSVSLTKKGEHQALTLANTILEKTRRGAISLPEIVLSSGFARADSTAKIVIQKLSELTQGTEDFNKKKEVVVKHNHLLRERDPGYGFEMTEEESQTFFPYLKQYWELEGKWFSTPPGGESLVSVMDRASLLLQSLIIDSRYINKTVYAFSHGGFMMATKMVIQGISCGEADKVMINPHNCQVHTYSNENGYWETVD